MKNIEDPITEEMENLSGKEGFETLALGSRDGLLLGATGSLFEGLDECVAMAATMLGAAEKIAENTKKGVLPRVSVEMEHGRAIIIGAGSKRFLLAIAKPAFNPEEQFFAIKESVAKIKQLLG